MFFLCTCIIYCQLIYSKTCVKQPLSKRPKIGFQDQLSLNAGQKYCRMLQGEHSAILSTFIKLPFVFKTFVLSIFEWPLKTGFTVIYCQLIYSLRLNVFNTIVFQRYTAECSSAARHSYRSVSKSCHITRHSYRSVSKSSHITRHSYRSVSKSLHITRQSYRSVSKSCHITRHSYRSVSKSFHITRHSYRSVSKSLWILLDIPTDQLL